MKEKKIERRKSDVSSQVHPMNTNILLNPLGSHANLRASTVHPLCIQDTACKPIPREAFAANSSENPRDFVKCNSKLLDIRLRQDRSTLELLAAVPFDPEDNDICQYNEKSLVIVHHPDDSISAGIAMAYAGLMEVETPNPWNCISDSVKDLVYHATGADFLEVLQYEKRKIRFLKVILLELIYLALENIFIETLKDRSPLYPHASTLLTYSLCLVATSACGFAAVTKQQGCLLHLYVFGGCASLLPIMHVTAVISWPLLLTRFFGILMSFQIQPVLNLRDTMNRKRSSRERSSRKKSGSALCVS